jgi:hypothetical protein
MQGRLLWDIQAHLLPVGLTQLRSSLCTEWYAFLRLQDGLPLLAVAADGYAYCETEFHDYYGNDHGPAMWRQALLRTFNIQILHKEHILDEDTYACFNPAGLPSHMGGIAVRYVYQLPPFADIIPPHIWPYEPILQFWNTTAFYSRWVQTLVEEHLTDPTWQIEHQLALGLGPVLTIAYQLGGGGSQLFLTEEASQFRHMALSDAGRNAEGLREVLDARLRALQGSNSWQIRPFPVSASRETPHRRLARAYPQFFMIEPLESYLRMANLFPWDTQAWDSASSSSGWEDETLGMLEGEDGDGY